TLRKYANAAPTWSQLAAIGCCEVRSSPAYNWRNDLTSGLTRSGRVSGAIWPPAAISSKVHGEHAWRRIELIALIGRTVFGSLMRRVERGSRRAHSSTGVVSFITASHSK